jgi:hypothetical protein
MCGRQITTIELGKQSNSTKKMKTILLFILVIFVLSNNNNVIGQSNTKTKEKMISKNHTSLSKSHKTKKSTIKQIQKADSIRICNISVAYKDTIALRNTIEYHLNNDIIYIKEYYPDKKLKSESYWVNQIIPIYQIKQYNEDGSVNKVIDKSIGKYDLCYVLNKIKSFKELEGKPYSIHLSNKSYDDNDTTWFITYNNISNRFGSDGDQIIINSKTGRTTDDRFSISDQPTNLIEPKPEQLPTYSGDIRNFEKYVASSIDIPNDSLVNAEINIRYSVDTYGNVGNFHVMGGTKYLNNEVLRIAKKMSKWQPAKDQNTDGACNVEGPDYGKYMFEFSVFFRRFD